MNRRPSFSDHLVAWTILPRQSTKKYFLVSSIVWHNFVWLLRHVNTWIPIPADSASIWCLWFTDLSSSRAKMPPKPKRKDADVTENLTRIAIVNDDKCKPKRCRQECKKSCPGEQDLGPMVLTSNCPFVCSGCFYLFVMAPRTGLESMPSNRRQLCHGSG